MWPRTLPHVLWISLVAVALSAVPPFALGVEPALGAEPTLAPVFVELDHLPASRAVRLLQKLAPGVRAVQAGDHVVRLHGGPDELSRARQWLGQIDRPSSAGYRIYVRPVLYRSAEELAPLLAEVAAALDPRARVLADTRSEQLVVVCTSATYAALHRAASRFDAMPDRASSRQRAIRVAPSAGAALPVSAGAVRPRAAATAGKSE